MAEFDVVLFYGVGTFIFSIISIFGNLMTVIAFLNLRSLRTNNPSNLFIFALAITNLSYGIYMFIYYGVPGALNLGHPYGENGCMLTVVLESSFNFGNLLLIAISLDRLLLVSLKYNTYVKFQTARRVKVAIGICFTIAFTNALIEIGLWKYAKGHNKVAAAINFDTYCLFPPRRLKAFGLYISFGFTVLPLFLVGSLSTAFFFLLSKKIRNVNRIGSIRIEHVENVSQQVEQDPNSILPIQQNEHTRTRNRYVKPAVTLAALVTSMSISLLPYCLSIIVDSLCSDCLNMDVLYIMVLIVQLNPLLDPFFYAATQRSIRQFYRSKIGASCKLSW